MSPPQSGKTLNTVSLIKSNMERFFGVKGFDFKEKNMSRSYVVTSYPSSAVTEAVSCSFTAPNSKDVVISKGNRIEVHTMNNEELKYNFEATIFGKIVTMEAYRYPNATQDSLFVLTARKLFCVLSYDVQLGKIVSKVTGNVKDRQARELETGVSAIVDNEHHIIAIMAYEGNMRVIPFDATTGVKESFNIRIEELRLNDIVFLHGYNRPTYAVLFEDSRGGKMIRTYALEMRDKESTACINQLAVDSTVSMLVPIEHRLGGGVLLVGQTSISLWNCTAPYLGPTIMHPGSQVLDVTAVSAHEGRYLLGDIHGQLMVLVFVLRPSSSNPNHMTVVGLSLDTLGETSIPRRLCYVDAGLVFVGSAFGDSQFVRLLSDKNEQGSYLSVQQTYTNVGPITDLVVVEEGAAAGSNAATQTKVVTCSGAYKDGSLRVIRSGTTLHEQASLEVMGVRGVWSLSEGFGHGRHGLDGFLVQSLVSETKVLGIDGEEMGEVDIEGFNLNERSLFCGNMGNFTVWVQVTSSAIYLVDNVSRRSIGQIPLSTLLSVVEGLAANAKFAVATANQQQLVVATTSAHLLYFEMNANNQLSLIKHVKMSNDVACLSIRPLVVPEAQCHVTVPVSLQQPVNVTSTAAPVTNDSAEINRAIAENILPVTMATIVCVGLWTENAVRLLTLPALEELTTVSIAASEDVFASTAQVRDVLLMSFTPQYTVLLAGLGDGSLITYQVSLHGSTAAEQDDSAMAVESVAPVVSGRRVVHVGSKQVSFACFTSKSTLCVMACCDRPTVLYFDRNKLLFSVVNVPGGVTGLASFHTGLFPESLALTNEEGLTISTIDEIKKVHVTSFPLKESPKRLCYSPRHAMYAVVSQRYVRSPSEGEGTVGRVLFFKDDGAMSLVHTHELDPKELGLSCTIYNCPAVEGVREAQQLFVIGTAQVVGGEAEPSRGRILVFAVSYTMGQQQLMDAGVTVTLVHALPVNGAVLSLTSTLHFVVAGVGNKMVLYRAADEPLVRLEESCSYGCDIFIISVKARDEFILYGDVLRSMTVLQYKPAGSTLHSGKVAAKDTLERVAKDYNINSLRAVEFFRDKDHYIGAEDFGNLFVGSRPPSSVPLEDIIKLHIESEFHLGDSVNCLRPGRLNVQPRDGGGAAEECDDLQSILFGTVSGGIGSIMAITEETFQFFSALEQAMRIVIQGLGGFSHQEFRTFHNGRRGNGATAGASSLTVDGDLIEQFVDLPKEEMLLVVRQLNDLFHLRRSAAGGGSKKMTQSAMSSEAVLTGTLWTKENYAAEDVIQAVEEMIRSH